MYWLQLPPSPKNALQTAKNSPSSKNKSKIGFLEKCFCTKSVRFGSSFDQGSTFGLGRPEAGYHRANRANRARAEGLRAAF